MILEKINEVNDIKKLTAEELEILAQEIREFLIEKISITGGHLAPNLIAVDIRNRIPGKAHTGRGVFDRRNSCRRKPDPVRHQLPDCGAYRSFFP